MRTVFSVLITVKVHKKITLTLDDMSIDKSLRVVYNISKDDRLKSAVMTTTAEVVGIRTGEKARVLSTGRQFENTIRRNTEVKMKKFISLALILVLTLICGVQIAADSAETQAAVCKHQWIITLGQYEVHGPWYCYVKIYEGTIKTCELCYAVEYPDPNPLLVGEDFRHSAKKATDGKYYCEYCHCSM